MTHPTPRRLTIPSEVSTDSSVVMAAISEAAEVILSDPRVDTPLLRAEAQRYLLQLISSCAAWAIEGADDTHPHLQRVFTPWSQLGDINPNNLFLFSKLNGNYTYRMRGTRGSAAILDFEIRASNDLMPVPHKEPEFGPNGEVDIVFSREPHEGNWLPLPDSPSVWFFFRQLFADWGSAEPARLTFEREGAAYPPPALTAEEVEDRLAEFAKFLVNMAKLSQEGAERWFAADPSIVPYPPVAFPGLDLDRDQDTHLGFVGQLYGGSNYRCELDQAVILEVRPPEAAFWEFHLENMFWQSLDFWMRATSINFHDAVLDDDGFFRAVISHQDPGVPNWLDTSGRSHGLIASRFVRPASRPEPTMRTVPLAELREHLPAATPVVTPEQRSAYILRRKQGILRVH